MMKKSVWLILLLSGFFFVSCGKRPVPKEKFAAVYVESLIIQEKFASDRAKTKSALEKLYAASCIDSAIYNSTLRYYSEDPERWDAFFAEAEKYLENKKKVSSF